MGKREGDRYRCGYVLHGLVCVMGLLSLCVCLSVWEILQALLSAAGKGLAVDDDGAKPPLADGVFSL